MISPAAGLSSKKVKPLLDLLDSSHLETDANVGDIRTYKEWPTLPHFAFEQKANCPWLPPVLYPIPCSVAKRGFYSLFFMALLRVNSKSIRIRGVLRSQCMSSNPLTPRNRSPYPQKHAISRRRAIKQGGLCQRAQIYARLYNYARAHPNAYPSSAWLKQLQVSSGACRGLCAIIAHSCGGGH